MVKCIVCGEPAAGDIGMCKGCMGDAQRMGISISVEQTEAEKMLDNVMAVAELTEETTAKNIQKAIGAMMDIKGRLKEG